MRGWWRQWRELGLPRCSSYAGCSGRLIWPWQEWICEIESWPWHHECYHRRTEEMLVWNLADEATSGRDYHFDHYDTCQFCHRVTPLTAVPT